MFFQILIFHSPSHNLFSAGDISRGLEVDERESWDLDLTTRIFEPVSNGNLEKRQ